MSNEKQLIKLESTIRQKMVSIGEGKLTPKKSRIGKLINSLKDLDEPLFDKIMTEYKEILKNR